MNWLKLDPRFSSFWVLIMSPNSFSLELGGLLRRELWWSWGKGGLALRWHCFVVYKTLSLLEWRFKAWIGSFSGGAMVMEVNVIKISGLSNVVTTLVCWEPTNCCQQKQAQPRSVCCIPFATMLFAIKLVYFKGFMSCPLTCRFDELSPLCAFE